MVEKARRKRLFESLILLYSYFGGGCWGGGVKMPLILPIRMGRYETGVQYWCISRNRYYRHIRLTKVVALEQ